MNRAVKSLGPPLAMLLCVAYLCWGHLAPPRMLEPSRPNMPRLNPKRMNPDLADKFERDPFRTTAVLSKADVHKEDEAAVIRANLRAARQKKQEAMREHVNQLVLNGAVLGNQPQAIINQRIFQVGDSIQLADSEVPLRVARIGRDWVKLDSELMQAKLQYGEAAQITMIDDPSLAPRQPKPKAAAPKAEPETKSWWQQLKHAVRNVSADGDG